MNTKLTLTLEKEIIEQAKKYASEKGRSLSEMVENYFKYVTEFKHEEKSEELSPTPHVSNEASTPFSYHSCCEPTDQPICAASARMKHTSA